MPAVISVAASSRSAELESYLDKYPEGSFASLARNANCRCRKLSRRRFGCHSRQPQSAHLAFWNSVKDSPRREELQAYLDQHPTGHFAALARARLSSPEVT